MPKIDTIVHKARKNDKVNMAYQIVRHDLVLKPKEERNEYVSDFVQTAIIERHFPHQKAATVLRLNKRDGNKLFMDISYYIEDIDKIQQDIDPHLKDIKYAVKKQMKRQAKLLNDINIERQLNDKMVIKDPYILVKDPINSARKHFAKLILDLYGNNKITNQVMDTFNLFNFDNTNDIPIHSNKKPTSIYSGINNRKGIHIINDPTMSLQALVDAYNIKRNK